MKVLSLQAENFKRLKSVFLRFGDGVNVISGPNGAGKSSCLDALAAVLGGETLCPAVPIREGEVRAEASVDLGDIVVTRKWGRGAGLYVKDREGKKLSSPQTLLDGMLSRVAFDPFAFLRAPAKAQLDALRQLVNVDFTLLDKERAEVFARRTVAHRERDQLKGALALQPIVNAPEQLVDISALLAEQDAILAEQKRIGTAAQARIDAAVGEERTAERDLSVTRSAANEADAAKVSADRREVRARAAVAELERQLAAAREEHGLARIAAEQATALIAPAHAAEAAAIAKLDAARAKTEQERGEPVAMPSLDEVRAQLESAEATNTLVRKRNEREAEAKKLAEKEREAARLTWRIEKIDEQKAATLAAARFPVDGLSFDDNGPTWRGLPLAQASSAEQWRVSVAMGLATHPQLKLMHVKDGSLLDSRSLALLGELAREAGAQVLVERVSEGGGAGIYIEDGEVVAVDGRPVARPAEPAEVLP